MSNNLSTRSNERVASPEEAGFLAKLVSVVNRSFEAIHIGAWAVDPEAVLAEQPRVPQPVIATTTEYKPVEVPKAIIVGKQDIDEELAALLANARDAVTEARQ